jgi:hypothetical protein
MSSSLIDLWSVVSGLSMGGLFMYLLCNNGFTINVNVNHTYVIEDNYDDDESVELDVAVDNVDQVELEEEILEDDNEVVENENKQD